MSLRIKLYGVILGMAVLGMVIMGSLNYTGAKKQLIELARESLESTAREISENVTQISERNAGLIKTIRPIMVGLYDQMADDMIIRDTLQQVAAANPQIQQLFIGTKDGEMLLVPAANLAKDFDPTSRKWYTLATDETVTVLGPYEDAVSGKTILTYSIHLTGDYGDEIGVLGLDVSMKSFQDLVAGLKVGRTGNAILMDNKGTIMADANEEHLGKDVAVLGKAMEDLGYKVVSGTTGIETIPWSRGKKPYTTAP